MFNSKLRKQKEVRRVEFVRLMRLLSPREGLSEDLYLRPLSLGHLVLFAKYGLETNHVPPLRILSK
jgi:hypothetical protein